MALLRILTDEDPGLRVVSASVETITPEVLQLIANMKETMLASKGAGLAAPQVGVNLRIFVALRGSKVVAFINPAISLTRGTASGSEGCLSLPGKTVVRTRAQNVTVRAQNEQGNWMQTDAKGFFARVIQHEIDHLNGVLMTDGGVLSADDLR